MLQELSPEQFRVLQAYDLIEGIGAERDDQRAAHMTAHLLASQGCDITPSQLRYDIDSLEDQQSEQEEIDLPSAIGAAFGLPPPPPKNR